MSTYSDYPFHVFANIGDLDHLVSVKQFSTKGDAEAWIVRQQAERPGYYEVIHEVEFDAGA